MKWLTEESKVSHSWFSLLWGWEWGSEAGDPEDPSAGVSLPVDGIRAQGIKGLVVIAHSLPTMRGTRCFKPSKNRFLRKVRKLLV